MADKKYRAVKSNDSDDVINIGADENQGGKDYNGLGTWCTFTFDEIPEPPDEVKEYIKDKKLESSLLKVENNKVMVKEIFEIF